jgi:hypothetical protein
MAAQANCLGVFLYTHVERSGAELRPQKADSCEPLAAPLGANRAARGCRSAGAAGVRDSLGTRRDRRVAALSYFDFTISGAIDPSEYVLAMVNTWKHGIAQVRLYDPYTPGVSRYLSRTNSRQRSSSRKSDSLSKSHGSGSFSGGRLSGWFILRTAF